MFFSWACLPEKVNIPLNFWSHPNQGTIISFLDNGNSLWPDVSVLTLDPAQSIPHSNPRELFWKGSQNISLPSSNAMTGFHYAQNNT